MAVDVNSYNGRYNGGRSLKMEQIMGKINLKEKKGKKP